MKQRTRKSTVILNIEQQQGGKNATPHLIKGVEVIFSHQLSFCINSCQLLTIDRYFKQL